MGICDCCGTRGYYCCCSLMTASIIFGVCYFLVGVAEVFGDIWGGSMAHGIVFAIAGLYGIFAPLFGSCWATIVAVVLYVICDILSFSLTLGLIVTISTTEDVDSGTKAGVAAYAIGQAIIWAVSCIVIDVVIGIYRIQKVGGTGWEKKPAKEVEEDFTNTLEGHKHGPYDTPYTEGRNPFGAQKGDETTIIEVKPEQKEKSSE
eukprot:GHVU01160372.1.p1 GENE.GHVU01160372.1~~GHVU01160372.1.p1  ORF type:complete len:204 (-),score=19.58 GHVU01160372.1:258-869(-)